MRILLTNTGPWGTGSFTVVEALVKEFEKLGHQVKLFFPDSGIESNDKDLYYSNTGRYHIWEFPIQVGDICVPTYPLITPHSQPRNLQGLSFKELSLPQLNFYFQVLQKELQKLILDFKPDVIECQHIWAMNYVVGELDYPHIVSAHMSDQVGFQYDARMQPYAKKGAKRAELIFSISNHVKKDVIDFYDVLEDKVVVMPNAFDNSVFQPKKVDRQTFLSELGVFNIPDDANLITFTGRIILLKGVDVVLEACRLIDPKYNVHFLMFGEGNIDDVLDLRQFDRSCFEHLHFLGHHGADTLSKAHNVAKISVAPSRKEGFGIAVLEAMATGLPVVVTKSGGPEDFAVGDIIEIEDPQALADAIMRILDLPDNKYRVLCDLSRKTANQFSWEQVAKMRMEYYKKLPTIVY